MKEYNRPVGYDGKGSDVKWCSRNKGRKKCCLCFKYTTSDVWTKEWNWFYLVRWLNDYYYEDYAHFKVYKPRHKPHTLVPVNYRSTGLKDFELKSLIKKGCKNNKRCKCASVVQRAFWYCPECYAVINAMAKLSNVHPHEIMLSERSELKAEILILRLSGSIQF